MHVQVIGGYDDFRRDVVEVRVPPPVPTEIIPENIPIDIIYEDDHMMAINKQTGIICHPSKPGQAGTIANADVWVDRETGLPLRLVVVGTGGSEALVTEVSGVSIGSPPADVVFPPAPPIARRSLETAPDLIARVSQGNPWAMPDRLAGLPASGPLLDGTTTYGTGLVRVAVLPLPPRTARDVLRNVESAGSAVEDLGGGQVARIGSSLLNAAVVRGDRGHAYVLTGLVEPALLEAVAADLLASPPLLRGDR